MAATESDRYPRRRFVTRHDVEDAASSGLPIRLRDRDVVTGEAAQRAVDLGVRIERDQAAGAMRGASARPPSLTAPTTAVTPETSDADLRGAVRSAVVAELGSEVPGLDQAIDRVLKARSR